MAGFGDVVQKAFYLGVGLASYAGEKAGTKLTELQKQAQKLADELVERGEMSTDEARRFVEDMVNQGRQSVNESAGDETPKEPRRIEILEDEEGEPGETEAQAPTQAPQGKGSDDVDQLRDRVRSLQDELRRLQNE